MPGSKAFLTRFERKNLREIDSRPPSIQRNSPYPTISRGRRTVKFSRPGLCPDRSCRTSLPRFQEIIPWNWTSLTTRPWNFKPQSEKFRQTDERRKITWNWFTSVLTSNPSHRREIDRHLYHEWKLLQLTEKLCEIESRLSLRHPRNFKP